MRSRPPTRWCGSRTNAGPNAHRALSGPRHKASFVKARRNNQSVHVRIPPLNGLVTFEAVARHGSFSKATDELSITQSAASHRLSQLESVLGVSLLLRAGHAISLTAQGEELLPHVREGLACLREGTAKLSGTRQKTIRLSLAPALASNWLVQRLAAFQRIHPDIDLDIIVTSKMINFRAGEADVGIRFGNGDWEGLDAIKLIPVRIFPVCSPAYKMAHPWLRTPSDLARSTLLRQAIIPWRPWFEAAGLDWAEPKTGPSFSEVSLLIDAAEFSQGVALILSALVERQLEKGTLVRLFDVEQISERSYYIVTFQAGLKRPEVESLVNWLLTTGDDTAAK